MNVPSKKELLQMFSQQQHDHPIGGIAARYVEQALAKHPVPEEPEVSRRKKKSRHSSKPSEIEPSEEKEGKETDK